jgi:hypothetical protein
MTIVMGIWFALAGGLATLAGLTGMRQTRQLRRRGVTAWATAIPPVSADDQPGGPPHRTVIRYGLADGRVIEQIVSEPAWKAAMLRAGRKVLIWYDPEDPRDILIHGREGRHSDRVFVAAGMLFILLGTAIAAFGH